MESRLLRRLLNLFSMKQGEDANVVGLPGDFEGATIEQIHHTVSPIAQELLEQRGFRVQKPLCWLRSEDAPVRQVFRLLQWKGGVVAPSWGVSLDFVPHVSRHTVKWHRTEKSAGFDLIHDADDRVLEMSFHHGTKDIAARAPEVFRLALERADLFWGSARTIADLPDAFAALKQESGERFYMRTPHALAYAFSLAKNGQREAGMKELEIFIARHETFFSPSSADAIKKRLWDLFDEALSCTNGQK